jgi:hypothetical protein
MSEVQQPPSDQGKVWAMLSYASFFFGFPLGVIPLLQRDDPYALRHAKHATAVWLAVFGLSITLGIAYTALSFVTCGVGAILFPMVLLPVPWAMLVGIHGLVITINGQPDDPIGTFGLGELMFGSITLKLPDEAPKQIPPTPPTT